MLRATGRVWEYAEYVLKTSHSMDDYVSAKGLQDILLTLLL